MNHPAFADAVACAVRHADATQTRYGVWHTNDGGIGDGLLNGKFIGWIAVRPLTDDVRINEILLYIAQPVRTQGGFFAQWQDTCPKCGGLLFVESVFHVATQTRRILNVPFHSDGFIFDSESKNNATTDEVIRCLICKTSYMLADLEL